MGNYGIAGRSSKAINSNFVFRGDFYKKKNSEEIKCVRCENMMTKRKSKLNHRVIVDCCKECGSIWFDDGEIKVLKNDNVFSKVQDFIRLGLIGSLLKNVDV